VSEVSSSLQKKNYSTDSTKDQIIGFKFGKGQKPASSQDCNNFVDFAPAVDFKHAMSQPGSSKDVNPIKKLLSLQDSAKDRV